MLILKKNFAFLIILIVFFSLSSLAGCSPSASITGSSEIKQNRKVTISSDKRTLIEGESAVISTLIENADGSVISGGGTLGTTGSSVTVSVSYSSNIHGTMDTSTDTFTLNGSTTTEAPDTASSISFHTTVSAISQGILTVSVTHLDIVASVNITVLKAF